MGKFAFIISDDTPDTVGAFDKLARVDPGLPPVRLNSFDLIPGAQPGQPQVMPCLCSLRGRPGKLIKRRGITEW